MASMVKAPTKKRLSISRFIGEIIAELKKVTWLSKREAVYLTALVLIVAVAVGIILGAMDYGFSFLVDKLFIGD
jgi:preprotein translocase subunit SecE|tara:strand:- start:1231 stop:1452 length:222 start_codon:yes stop_codon:yes gene_type:complete